MDGVLCDFDLRVRQLYAELYPEDVNLDPTLPTREFYISARYREQLGEIAEARVQQIIESKGFFDSLPPIDGAVEAFNRLSNLPGVSINICTSPLSRYRYCLAEKCRWVERWLGERWVGRTIITKDKTLVRGDILIDDKGKIVGDEENPEWRQVLYDQPYNRHLTDAPRICDWRSDAWMGVLRGIGM